MSATEAPQRTAPGDAAPGGPGEAAATAAGQGESHQAQGQAGTHASRAEHDHDIILLSHVWFRRKRTGEEFSRNGHALIMTVLVVIFLMQIMVAHFPSMMRENAVGVSGGRCQAGCFHWSCGSHGGTVASGTCSGFDVTMSVCRGASIGNLFCVGVAMIVEATEIVRPGMMSIRYRYVITPLTFAAGFFLLISVMDFLVTWNKDTCGIIISDAFQLSYGWVLSFINSVVLFYTSHSVWKGKSPW